jgi:hypothetical protein
MPLYKAVDVSSLPDAASIGWADVDFYRDADNVIAQRDGASAQTFRVYNTYTDASNYERLSVGWAANQCTIKTEAAGTGTARGLDLAGANGYITAAAHVVPATNGTYDVGVSGTAWRSLYLSGGVVGGIVTKTADYTATANDFTIRCDATSGAVTITLPAAASHTGRIYRVKKVDASANAVTIDGNSSETIDGSATVSSTTQYASWTIQSNGTNWDII